MFGLTMKATVQNVLWFVAFLLTGIFSALIAMGQALGDGLDLSVLSAGYSVGRGLIAGLIVGFGFLLFWCGNLISSTKLRFVELGVFAMGWFLAFYIPVAVGVVV